MFTVPPGSALEKVTEEGPFITSTLSRWEVIGCKKIILTGTQSIDYLTIIPLSNPPDIIVIVDTCGGYVTYRFDRINPTETLVGH